MEKHRKLTRKEKIERSKQAPSGLHGNKKSEENHNRLLFTLGLIVAVFGLLLYVQTINYSYTLDDRTAITDNLFVKQGFGGIGSILKTSYHYGSWFTSDDLYRPLSLVMFAVEWQFFPDNPAAGHVINVLLYALTGFLLFRLLCRLFKGNVWIPFAASLLFMAHPVHTEVVASIKSRDEILCFLFSVISIQWLLDFLQYKKNTKLFLSCFAYFLALMSKESAIALLPVIPLLFFVFYDFQISKAIVRIIPFILTALVYLGIRAMVLKGVVETKELTLYENVLVIAPDFISRFATAMYVLGRYLVLLFLPLHMSMDYSYSEITIMKITDFRVLISLAVYLGILIYAMIKIRTKDVIAFSIFFYLATIFIVSNLLIMIGTVMGDRLLYMPSLGFCLLIAIGLSRVFKIEKTSDKILTVPLFLKANGKPFFIVAAVLILFSFKTINRNPVWKNNFSLHLSGIHDSPNSSRNHHNLATEWLSNLAVEKDNVKRDSAYQECINEYKKAIESYPGNDEAYRDLGYVYMQINDSLNAIKYYDLALKYNPRDPKSLSNKGTLLFNQKKYGEAIDLFKEAVKWNPGFTLALKNMGNSYGALADYDQALFYFKKALDYPMDDASRVSVYRKIAQTYRFMGNESMMNDYTLKANSLEAGSK